MSFMESFSSELKSRNFSIYGQWTGLLCILLCIAIGISNLFHHPIIIAFSILCLISGLLLIFIEIQFLLRICPTSKKFDELVRKIEGNYRRAAVYLVMALIQWLSLLKEATSLIAAAVLLTLTGVFYLLAGVTGQEFKGSQTLRREAISMAV